MEHSYIISKFIKQLTNKDNILGIVFYGSSCYHTNNKESDIDLLIVTNNGSNYKGVTYIDDIKIEYFEKNIYYLIDKIKDLESNPDRSLVSIFKNGHPIYSKNKTIEFLKEEILKKQNYYPKKNKSKYSNADYDITFFYEQMTLLKPNTNLFNYFYFNLLEAIRKKYHEQNKYSKIPSLKVYELYCKTEYAKEIYCVKLPGQDFMKQYLDLINNEYNPSKLEFLFSLIDHSDDFSMESFSNKYNKNELDYHSTIVNNAVNKSSYYIKTNNPAKTYCYYITLEKIRNLYCDIHNINSKENFLESDYDQTFLELFDLCLNDENKADNLNNLFNYVTSPLKINYKNYKVYELS